MAIPDLAWEEPYQTIGQTPITDVFRVRDDATYETLYAGNNFLLQAFGFVRGIENFSRNRDWRYTFFESPRFPNSRLMSYRRMRGGPIGHMVAIIIRGNVAEYYNSTGRTAHEFPDDVIQAITRGHVLEDVVTNVHQINEPLCSRYALYRATFGNKQNNAGYNEMLITMRNKYALPSFGDVIWNSSQNTLARLGQAALVL
jgi:hypothetical protein